MPADPADADPLISPLGELFGQLEAVILAILAQAAAEQWSAARVRQAVAAATAGMPGLISDAVTDALMGAQATGQAEAVADAPGANKITRLPLPKGRRFMDLLDAIIRQAPSAAARLHQTVNDQVTSAMTAGKYGTRVDASADLLAKYAGRGLTGFTDAAGRNWDLVSYAEMVARTTTAQTLADSYLNQLASDGHDLVSVSDAPEECKYCRPFEGKVLAISGPAGDRLVGEHRVHVTATVAAAVAAGFHHPNCRHRLLLFQPGISTLPAVTRDPEGAALREQQRYRERQIRKLKRQVLVTEQTAGRTSAPARSARAKLRASQAAFKQWRTDNDRKNLTRRTSLTLR